MAATPLLRSSENPDQLLYPAKKQGIWPGQKRERLVFYVILSALVHVTLLGSLLIYHAKNRGPGPQVKRMDDFSAFRDALRDINPMPDDPKNLASLLATLTDEDFKLGFSKAPQLDDRLTSKERASVYKTLISKSAAQNVESLGTDQERAFTLEDLFAESGKLKEISSPDGSKLLGLANSKESGIKFYKLSKDRAQRLQSLKAQSHPIAVSQNVSIRTESGINSVPAEHFYRQAPFEQMLALGARLFYFVEGFPPLEPEKEDSSNTIDGASVQGDHLSGSKDSQPNVSFVFLQSPRTDDSVRQSSSPAKIDLRTDSIPQILDSLIELSDEEQFEKFDRDYLQVYDPDSPLLADLTSKFIYQNLGTVFILTDSLSAGFDFLEGIYYRKLNLGKFLSYYRRNQDTRTGAEILFSLAAYYDLERRSLLRLWESAGIAEQVLANPAFPIDVYDKQAKAFVLQQVCSEVRSEFLARGFASIEAVLLQYREHQLALYETLAKMGSGYRDRALYCLGTLYWDDSRIDMALKTWRKVGPDYSVSPFPKIRDFLAVDEPGILEANIARVIDDEAIANRQQMAARLGKFHKWDKAQVVSR